MSDVETIDLQGVDHPVGDCECSPCWAEYPKPCECGGLVHASFGDYTAGDSYYLVTRCDRCGESE